MNIIYGERGSGKTTMLVMTSAVMNKPIICRTRSTTQHIQDVATELGVNIPKPRVHERGNYYDDGVLLDDADQFIRDALENYIGTCIDACTFNIDGNSVMKRKES